MNYLSTIDETPYVGTLVSVDESQSIRLIETQLLSGEFAVQTIGEAAKRLGVTFYCSSATRRQLEEAQAQAAYIKIYWLDQEWTGLISSKRFGITRWSRNIADLHEQVKFEVLVAGVV